MNGLAHHLLPFPIPKRGFEMATVTTTAVDRVKTVTVQEQEYLLKLDEMQAGYLYDLLYRFVSGDVAGIVFAPIAKALRHAGINTLKYRAKNENKELTKSESDANGRWGFYGYVANAPFLVFRSDEAKKAAEERLLTASAL